VDHSTVVRDLQSGGAGGAGAPPAPTDLEEQEEDIDAPEPYEPPPEPKEVEAPGEFRDAIKKENSGPEQLELVYAAWNSWDDKMKSAFLFPNRRECRRLLSRMPE
jgi:hypothetical protein